MKRKVILICLCLAIFSACILVICFLWWPLHYEAEVQPSCTESGHIGYYQDWFKRNYIDKERKEFIDISEILNIDSDIYNQKDENGQTIKDKYKSIGHTDDGGEIATAATCTDTGIITYKCIVCGEAIRIETIPALGHDLIKVEAKVATCEVDGNIEYWECSRCGEKFSDKNASNVLNDIVGANKATGHNTDSAKFTNYTEDINNPGMHTYLCGNKNCNGVEEPCFENENEGWSTPDDCTVSMNRSRTCPDCGYVQIHREEPLSEHIWGEWQTVTNATCTGSGCKMRACTVCRQIEKESISATGHTPVIRDNYWEDLSHYVAPTVNMYAKIPYYCSVCGEFLETKQWSDAESDDTVRKAIRIEDKYYANTSIMYDEKIGSLGLNLFAMDDNLTGFGYSGYDSSSHVLKISSSYNGKGVVEAKIIGRPNIFNNFAIETENFVNLTLILQDISFVAPSGHVGLDLSNVVNAELKIENSVSIKGNFGGDGISAQNLLITGDYLTVEGGQGIDGSSVYGSNDCTNGNGKTGGAGINVNYNLTLALEGRLTVIGGVGGAAYNRPAGDNDGEGSDGRPGCAGGTGGAGLIAQMLQINSGIIVITAGDGGQGGNASECNRKQNVYDGKVNVQGGQGGAGGYGGIAIEALYIYINQGDINAIGGAGGNSGQSGGCHDGPGDNREGKYGPLPNQTSYARDGEPGAIGIGGLAISANCSIFGEQSKIHKTKGKDGTVTTGLNQN